jgi:hypothetical protein
MRGIRMPTPRQSQLQHLGAMSAADIEAREAAHNFNYGPSWAAQPSPLHVLATTGAIKHDRCIEEIEHSRSDLPRGTSTVKLDELRAYIETIGDRRSVPGWVAPAVTTEYGVAAVGSVAVEIRAGHHELHAWATRHGSRWPCSQLARLERIAVAFDRHGLVSMETAPEVNDLAANELNAWSSDVLRVVIPTDHPVYYISVGQFDGEPAPAAELNPLKLADAEAIVRRPGLYPREVWEQACQTVHADVHANA